MPKDLPYNLTPEELVLEEAGDDLDPNWVATYLLRELSDEEAARVLHGARVLAEAQPHADPFAVLNTAIIWERG